MDIGIISQLFQEKEYGKIKINTGEAAHFNKHCLWDTQFKDLAEGQEVEFEIQKASKGFLAFHIRPHDKNVTVL